MPSYICQLEIKLIFPVPWVKSFKNSVVVKKNGAMGVRGEFQFPADVHDLGWLLLNHVLFFLRQRNIDVDLEAYGGLISATWCQNHLDDLLDKNGWWENTTKPSRLVEIVEIDGKKQCFFSRTSRMFPTNTDFSCVGTLAKSLIHLDIN